MYKVLFEFAASAAQQPSVAKIEPKLLVLVTDKVEDGENVLPLGLSKAPSELLKKDCRTLGGAEHQDHVYRWYVDTLIEQVDRKEDLSLS